jgi:adenosine deaminase
MNVRWNGGRARMRFGAAGVGLVLVAAMLGGATPPPEPATAEARTAAYFDRIADSPPRLRLFLQTMPKGGDLHNHAGGAIYAEDMLGWAAAEGLCLSVNPAGLAPAPCDAPGRISAATLVQDYPRYAALVDAFSTRGFEAGTGDPQVSGYDRFFSTFDAFWPIVARHGGKVMAIARQQAAADGVSYGELSTGSAATQPLLAKVGDGDVQDLAALYDRIAPELPAAVRATRAQYDGYDAEMAAIDGCRTAMPKPACATEIRYQFAALRTRPPAQVFAELALGFALVQGDPRFVAVNIVAPEHHPVALRDYALHMRMLRFLKDRFPAIPLSLHAGELTLGLVPPRDLRFHIRDAVVVAGARRIGHGIDIPYETDARALLARMAREQVAVEINLTSNAVILGVKGRDHPLSLYRQAGVPVVLSTDDEGVSRTDMTNEYLRAVTEQKLRYRDLKQIARDSLHYAFLPGASLWQDRAGGPRVATCRVLDTAACRTFLAIHAKARLEARLERDFDRFERQSFD